MDSKLENNEGRPVLDVVALRDVGIERISRLSGKIWNDYNASDPGITLLEILCFSIMDLGYRMTFDVRDLLTKEGEKNPQYEKAFHEPYQVLSTAPLTINDYRKLILENVKGVKNIWLKAKTKQITLDGIRGGEKHNIEVKGFYDVFVDLQDEKKKEEVLDEVTALLHKNRNLCEDFDLISHVGHVSVGIKADIEVETDGNYDAILSKILQNLSWYISPDLRLYSLDEMLQKGKSISDIFTGPLPKRGYVDMSEMENFEDNHSLYVSDMINIIMQIDGVKGVRHLSFFIQSKDIDCVEIERHKISLKNEFVEKKSFRLLGGNAESKSKACNRIDFLLNDFRFTTSPNSTALPKKTEAEKELEYRLDKDISRNRKLDRYYTVQESLPDIYMVGQEKISDDESNLRKAQRLQLKGYLLFFDQLLADFLMRLNSAKHMLSWEKSKDLREWKDRQQEYLHRILTNADVDDLDKVVGSGYKSFFRKDVFDTELQLKQKDKALNSLLARFNEDFTNYSIMQYILQNSNSTPPEDHRYELICNKSTMLDKLPILGYWRYGAIDYHSKLSLKKASEEDYFDEGNYYAIERNLYIKLGLKSYTPKKKLHPKVKSSKDGIVFIDNRKADFSEAFGLHVYEHNLLLPKKEKVTKGKDSSEDKETTTIDNETFLYQYRDNDRTDYSKDPYSMKVTVALPGWLDIVQNHQFRNIVENTIIEEFPAHIAVKVCWIGPLQMMELEESFEIFLDSIRDKSYNDTELNLLTKEKLKTFIKNLSQLNNVYREAYTTSIKEDTVINKTLLGYATLKGETYKWDSNN